MGYYDVWIDREKTCTVHEKNGPDRTKLEKVKECYQEGDTIIIKFENGDSLKHFMKSKETVKISSNKQIVEHLYPDGSVVADSKETKLKHINNK